MKPGQKKTVTVYSTVDGRIDGYRSVPIDGGGTPRPGFGWKDGRHSGRIDLETGEAVPLLDFNAVVTTGENWIAGIPDGTQVMCHSRLREPADGRIDFVVDYNDTVTVKLSHPLYEMKSYQVVCTPAHTPKRGAATVEHRQDYARMRRGSYPDAGEQLGAAWKIIDALLAGETPPADAMAVRDSVLAVKDKFQKKGDG